MKFREYDHPADIAMEVTGRDYDELFTNALESLYFILFDKPVSCKKDDPNLFEVNSFGGFDYEEILIGFLSEMHYQCLVKKQMAFITAPIQFISRVDSVRMDARIKYELLEEKGLEIVTEVKAVTFHNVHINKKGRSFQVRLIFDI